jgi:putative ABC transport system permease protein
MRQAFFVRLAIVNTFKKRLRAILAVGSIALTVAAMVSLYGIEIGLKSLINNEISSSDSRDVVTITQRNNQEVRLDEAQLSKIQSISGVSQIGQSVGLVGSAVYHGIDLSMPIYAISDNYFSLSPNKALVGSISASMGEEGIIVSKKALDVMGISESEAVGTKIKADVVVAKSYFGGVESEGQKLGAKEYEIKAVIDRGELPVSYVAIEPLRAKGLDSVSQLKVRLTSPEKSPAVRETVEQMGFQTTSVQDTIDQIEKLFLVINNTLFVFTVVVFVVTVSGAFTVISLTLIEETRQIGFLRIVGLRSMDVRTLFVIQSIVLTTLGASIGVVAGSLLGMVINGLAKITASAESFSGDISIFIIPVQAIIMILMLAVVIGWLVGIIPAKRAVLIDPLEELRS